MSLDIISLMYSLLLLLNVNITNPQNKEVILDVWKFVNPVENSLFLLQSLVDYH